MGAQQPFLYDAPSNNTSPYAPFNPKAVTEASRREPKPKPKHEGPLVDFNKHPDSYLILPYGNTNAKPMSPRTRKRVKYNRWLLLFLRCLQLVGAIGLLVCLICVRKVEEVMGWTIRIPPGIAILHSVYAIYHLSRGSTRRTPASSSSYMLFSAVADTALLPFYVFTALMSKTQSAKGSRMAWKSVFDDPVANDKLVRAVFLFAVVNGGIHILSLGISLYLAITFHKIAKLPPDMNPLEDNLTSRHKKFKSSISEKRSSQATSTTSFSGPTDLKRISQADEPLIPPPRTVPFMHTRTNSTESFSARSPKRNSRADLPSQVYQQSSRGELTRSTATHSPTKRSPYDMENTPPKRNSRQALVNDNWYTYLNHESPTTDENLGRADSTVSSMKAYEIQMAHKDDVDNGDDFDDDDDVDHNDENLSTHKSHPNKYQPLQQTAPTDAPPRPLESHPPTPPPAHHHHHHHRNARLLQNTTPSRINSLKARLYGDLKPATPPVIIPAAAVSTPPSGSNNNGPGPGRGGASANRVISNSSGVEYYDYSSHHVHVHDHDHDHAAAAALGAANMRNVSGKAAEEGRAGAGTSGWARFRKVSGR